MRWALHPEALTCWYSTGQVWSQPNGTTFCGTHLETGAEVRLFERLDPGIPAPTDSGSAGAAPTRSALPPAPRTPVHLGGGAWFVQTGRSCDFGGIVTVTPTDGARLGASIPARDGRIAGIVLVEITTPVTVTAWVGGKYQGALRIDAPTRPRSS